MWQAMHGPGVRAVQADALFVSAVQCCDEPDCGQVRRAVAAAIGAFGSLGCAGRVAQEFGDHPETAVVRMRWARVVVREAFPDLAPQLSPCPDAGLSLVAVPQLSAAETSGSQEPGGLSVQPPWQARKASALI
jgi:hypothetical protein